MDGDTSLSFLPFSFPCSGQGTPEGTESTPILAGQGPRRNAALLGYRESPLCLWTAGTAL